MPAGLPRKAARQTVGGREACARDGAPATVSRLSMRRAAGSGALGQGQDRDSQVPHAGSASCYVGWTERARQWTPFVPFGYVGVVSRGQAAGRTSKACVVWMIQGGEDVRRARGRGGGG